ncbi:hypothetical protein [Spongiimicrobium salis]|uniref:hypothetical protein n=1 Tax=Spongiimicrobium salis TaxID=1667022 RepID=UPI00374D30E9
MASSTIEITINVIQPNPSPETLGAIRFSLDQGFPLHLNTVETIVPGVASSNQMTRATQGFAAGGTPTQQALSDEQALYYSQSLIRDYGNIMFGTEKMFTITRSGNVVRIVSANGQFINTSYDGNILDVTFTDVTTGPIQIPVTLNTAITANGNCDTIDYTVSASGSGTPFTLTVNGTNAITNWDGTQDTISLNRGVDNVVVILNDVNENVAQSTIRPPRKLIPGEFKERTTLFEGFTDVEIESVNPVANTEPEYSLDLETASNGTNYQTSNLFPNITDGTYKLFIRDRYGCEVSKTIVLLSLPVGTGDGTGEQQTDSRYLEVVPLNSIPFSYKETITSTNKKNHTNTIGVTDITQLRYNPEYGFTNEDRPPIQFKSSYPYNIMTLHNCDGTKNDIPFIEVVNNLGVQEKVDCNIFPHSESEIGVYFDGGNQYQPSTTTILADPSPYTDTVPDWMEEDQLVNIGSVGSKRIKEISYREDINKFFFIVDGTVATESTTTIQVTFNIQPYNLFQCEVDMTESSGKSYITLEGGYNINGVTTVDRTMISEPFKKIEDNDNWVLSEWYSDVNLGGMVFVTGIKHFMRNRAKFRPISFGESQLLEGDDRSYSLDQVRTLGYRATYYQLSTRVWETISNATGVSKYGTFKINGLVLNASGAPEQKEFGESNMNNLNVEFRYGGNSVAVNEDVIALNPSTGVENGGSTGKGALDITPHDGRIRLTLNGNLLTIGGSLIYAPSV